MGSVDLPDPMELERVLRRMAADRLRTFVIAVLLWSVVQAVVLAVTMQPWVLQVANAATLGVGVTALVVRQRGRLGSSGLTGVGVATGLVQLVTMGLLAKFTGQRMFFWIVPLAFVSSGVLILHRAWLLGFLSAGIAISLALSRGSGYPLWTDAVLLTAGAFIGTILHVVGLRAVLRVEALRARDARQNVALESALADARRELADRRRAEAEGAQLREQFMHAQKMEAVGTLAGGFAHDMNNVLGGILGAAELLREDIPAEFHEDLDGIIESTQRGAELTRNLLGFARRGKYRRERVELGTVVGDLVKLLARTVPKGVTFEVDVARPGPIVEGDPTLITQALVNLCLNSVDAMRGVGRVTISATQIELDAERAAALDVTPGRYVEIGVADSGSGMDAATVQRIFEPFFTTKDVGRGTGLGLPMVYGTVRSHGGAIEVTSTVGTGTTMRLYLPAVDAITVQEAPKPKPMPFVVTTSGTILVVDDDERIRRVGRRILEGRGYRVLEVGDGRAALELYKEHPEVDLVVLDMAMPVMGGAECFAALRLFDPNARVLLASGYTIEEDARRCLADGAVGFVDKPYTVDTLVTAVTRAMRGEPLQKGEF